MADSVSPGSSQRGASVTWKAYVTWPSGPAASAVLPGAPGAQIAKSTTTAATNRVNNLTMNLLGGSSRLEPNVLVRRRVRVVGDQGEGRLVNLRPHTPNESVFPDPGEHDAIVEDPLDLMEQRLALLAVELSRLLLEEVFDFGEDAVRVPAAPRRQQLDSSRRVAARARSAQHDTAELLLPPARKEGGALQRPHPRLDPDGAQVVGDGLRHGVVGRLGRELATVEAVRVAGLDQELLGALRVVGVWIDGDRELDRPRDDVAGDPGKAELLGFVDRLPIDGEARGEPHPLVVPRRLRVPLLDEVEEEDPVGPRGDELQPGRPPDLLGHRARQEIRYVHLATLERGRTRRLVGDTPEDQALDARRLAPVAVERLEDQLHARGEADEPVRSGADRGLLEALVADTLDVLLGHDPAGARRRRPVERHEVGPRLLEEEPDPARVDDLQLLDLVLEELRRPAAVTLEGEFHVLGGDGLAVVELGPLAQHELVAGAVGGHRPRLREARRGQARGPRPYPRVVERVEDLERRGDGLRLRGVEPARGEGNVERPHHLACRGRLRGPHVSAERPGREKQRGGDSRSGQRSHDWPPRRTVEIWRLARRSDA